jgi:hypothetical protein
MIVEKIKSVTMKGWSSIKSKLPELRFGSDQRLLCTSPTLSPPAASFIGPLKKLATRVFLEAWDQSLLLT